ncbi:hypothetical protein Q0M59_18910, partial [Staphylococcus aureus]|nr:hypothetical protein [Staphylococcus aureus]
DAYASTKSKDLSVQPTSQQHNPVKGAKGNVATTQAKVQTQPKVINRNQVTKVPSKQSHVVMHRTTAQISSQNVSKQNQPTKVN